MINWKGKSFGWEEEAEHENVRTTTALRLPMFNTFHALNLVLAFHISAE